VVLYDTVVSKFSGYG